MSAILLLILDRITGATGRLDSISLRMGEEGSENIRKWKTAKEKEVVILGKQNCSATSSSIT